MRAEQPRVRQRGKREYHQKNEKEIQFVAYSAVEIRVKQMSTIDEAREIDRALLEDENSIEQR